MEQKFDINVIKAVIGLGNPGAYYAKHRRTVGFRVIDSLAHRLGAAWQQRTDMEWASARIPGCDHDVLLIKPLTFMNNSGAIIPWLQKKGIAPEQILVLHDELEKPFGASMIKFGGSHRGHNGLKSIIAAMGLDFWRLRFGIGRPEDKDAVPGYVTSNFLPSQEQQVAGLVEQAVDLVLKTVILQIK